MGWVVLLLFSACFRSVLSGFPLECQSSNLINFRYYMKNFLDVPQQFSLLENDRIKDFRDVKNSTKIKKYPILRDKKCNFTEKASNGKDIENINIIQSFSKSEAFKKYVDLLSIIDERHISSLSNTCRKDLMNYIGDLQHLKLWAMKMYDSSAKLSSGLLNGNVHQYGDFDQCLRISSNDIKGKYCLASFQIKLKPNVTNELRILYDLMQSHHALSSTMKDPGHRIPRFSSITWGVCVPNSCTHRDVQKLIENTLDKYIDKDSVDSEVSIHPEMCQVRDKEGYLLGTKIVGMILMMVICFVLYATLQDKSESKRNVILSCFSLKNTTKSLFSLKRADDDITTVHGIRFLNAIMLIVAHKSMAIFYYPMMNRTEMSEALGERWSVIGRAASLYTDPFIMFSGLLTCYSLMKDFDKNKEVHIWKEYIGRLFRLVPTLSVLILFCTWILPVMGSGPQWPLVIQHHSTVCKSYWWRNFMFIHNYFGFEKMCLTHTHHVGIDTQLFFVGVPFVVLMGLKKQHTKKILLLFLLLAIISTVARFYTSYTMQLSNFIYYGVSVERLFKTADYMYILPPYRFTVYAMGIFLAFLLRKPLEKPLTKLQLTIGWCVSLFLFCISFFGSSGLGCIGYKYNPFHNALHASLGPIAWCACFGWIIYTTHHGYNSFIGEFFSWRGFLIWTRISYAVYLTQFPIFFYFIGITRTPIRYSVMSTLFDLGEHLCILVSSIIMTLLFDLPFQNLKKIIFTRSVKTGHYQNGVQKNGVKKLPNTLSSKEISQKTD